MGACHEKGLAWPECMLSSALKCFNHNHCALPNRYFHGAALHSLVPSAPHAPFMSCREGFAHHTGLSALWSQESDWPVWIPVQPQSRPAGLVPLQRRTGPGLGVSLCAYLYLSYINSCYKDKEGEAEELESSGHYTPGTVLNSFLFFTPASALLVRSY